MLCMLFCAVAVNQQIINEPNAMALQTFAGNLGAQDMADLNALGLLVMAAMGWQVKLPDVKL
jgi:hypothetical protein